MNMLIKLKASHLLQKKQWFEMGKVAYKTGTLPCKQNLFKTREKGWFLKKAQCLS